MSSTSVKAATLSGLSIGITDIRMPAKKQQLIDATQKKVDRVERNFQAGSITERERHNQLLDLWAHCREQVTKSLVETLEHDRRNLPTQMSMGSDMLYFRYDGDGQRIYKKLVTGSGQTETFYLRGVDGRVLAVYVKEGGGGPQLQYWNILSGGTVIGRIVPPSG